MYLLHNIKSDTNPFATLKPTLCRSKLPELPEETKIGDLRVIVAELLQKEKDSFILLYCGKILNDDKSIRDYHIKPTSSIHALAKPVKQAAEENTENRIVTEDEIRKFRIAFRSAIKQPAFCRITKEWTKKDGFHNLVLATPNLAKDPIAWGFISDPALLITLLKPDTYRKVAKNHPCILEVANQLAAAIHEETPSANVEHNSDSSSSDALSSDMELATGDEESEGDEMPGLELVDGAVQNSSTGINANQLADALNNANANQLATDQNVIPVTLLGSRDRISRISGIFPNRNFPPNDQPTRMQGESASSTTITSRSNTSATLPVPSTSQGITQDQLRAALSSISGSYQPSTKREDV